MTTRIAPGAFEVSHLRPEPLPPVFDRKVERAVVSVARGLASLLLVLLVAPMVFTPGLVLTGQQDRASRPSYKRVLGTAVGPISLRHPEALIRERGTM